MYLTSARPNRRKSPEIREAIFHFGLAAGFVHVGIGGDLVDDASRSLGGATMPSRQPLKTRQRFRYRRHVRPGSEDGSAEANRRAIKLSGFDNGSRNSEIVEHQIDVAGEQARRAGRRPAYGMWRSLTCHQLK